MDFDKMIQFLNELNTSEDEYIAIDDIHMLSEQFLRISILLAKGAMDEEIFHKAVEFLWERAPEDSLIMLPPSGEA